MNNTRDASHYDVLVVGLGPAGASAARALAARGLHVLGVDRKAFPRYKVCGGCLSARAVNLLKRSGIGRDRLGGVDIRRFDLWAAGRAVSFDLAGGIAVSRARLDAILAGSAEDAGATLRFAVTATNPKREAGNWRVSLRGAHGTSMVSARAVVVSDGLSGRFLAHTPEFRRKVWNASHIGAGTVLEKNGIVAEGVIEMVHARGGYVGLTTVEDGFLNVAAALAPKLTRSEGSVGRAVGHILEAAGYPNAEVAAHARWRGTPALTARTDRVACDGLFVAGDAASYVEPFTGEGMTWALEAGDLTAGFVTRYVRDGDSAACRDWDRFYRRRFRAVQQRCGWVARGLRAPGLSAVAATVLGGAPWVTAPIVRHIHGSNW